MVPFLMVCPEYEPLRYEFFPYNMLLYVSFDAFNDFMKTEDEYKIRCLA